MPGTMGCLGNIKLWMIHFCSQAAPEQEITKMDIWNSQSDIKAQRGSSFRSQGGHGGLLRKDEVQIGSWRASTVIQVKRRSKSGGKGIPGRGTSISKGSEVITILCIHRPLGSPSCQSTAIMTWVWDKKGKEKIIDETENWGKSKSLRAL